MSGFEDLNAAARMRDLFVRMAEEAVTRLRPSPSMAQVKSWDRIARTARVVFAGTSEEVPVRMGVIQPSTADQWVRIEDKNGNRYITDVVGLAYMDGSNHQHFLPDGGAWYLANQQAITTAGDKKVMFDTEAPNSGTQGITKSANDLDFEIQVSGRWVFNASVRIQTNIADNRALFIASNANVDQQVERWGTEAVVGVANTPTTLNVTTTPRYMEAGDLFSVWIYTDGNTGAVQTNFRTTRVGAYRIGV